VVSLLLTCVIEQKDELIAELYDWSTTGIVEDEQLGGECLLEAFFDTADEAEAVKAALAQYEPVMRIHGERDYVREFQAHWGAQAVGKRLWLAAPWDEAPVPEGRLKVEYQAGMACGSGAHPCTRLCLEALEDVVREGSSVLDVGVGSGILLMAARVLGAGMLAGCDIDHDSVVLAREAVPEAHVFTGSTRSVAAGRFAVVIANISGVAAEQMRSELQRVCASGGVMIVSGFRVHDVPDGFGDAEQRELEGWACLLRRDPSS